MASKRKTKKDLEREILVLNTLVKNKDETIADMDRMLSISRDNEYHEKSKYQKEEVSHRQTQRRAQAAANLLKGTDPLMAEKFKQLAIGLLENRALVDVAEDLATEIDPMCNVVMVSCGPRKIEAIKALRNEFGLGLKDSKDLTDRAPVDIAKVTKSRADEMVRRLSASGMYLEVKPC